MNHVVCLQKDLAKTRFSHRVVLEIEAIESVEDLWVGVNIESINAQIMRRKLQTLKNFPQSQVLAITEDHNSLNYNFGKLRAREHKK